jgi:hypothetical protein
MAYISCNTWCATDIIETERGDEGSVLRGSDNASTGAKDGNVHLPCS